MCETVGPRFFSSFLSATCLWKRFLIISGNVKMSLFFPAISFKQRSPFLLPCLSSDPLFVSFCSDFFVLHYQFFFPLITNSVTGWRCSSLGHVITGQVLHSEFMVSTTSLHSDAIATVVR